MNDRELDDLLDRALRRYSEVEPGHGVESRVLQRAHSPSRRRSIFAWLLVSVTACAAVAIVAFWALKPIPEVPKVAALHSSPPAMPAMVATARPKRSIRPAARRQPPPAPRLSPEERALADVAARDPAGLLRSFDRSKEQTSEPIQIAAIEVKPLESKEQ